MNYYDIFFDIIENIFDFLIIDLFIKNNGYNFHYKHIFRPVFLTFRIFYAIITFPNWFVYILNIIILAYILVSCNGALYQTSLLPLNILCMIIFTFIIILLRALFFEIYYKLLQINFTHIIIRLRYYHFYIIALYIF